MNKTASTETLKIIKWARKQGALLIKVNGVELTFPPDIDVQPVERRLPIGGSVISNKALDKKAEEFIRNPSALDDPDYLIQEQDAWAAHRPPPRLG